MIPNSHPFFRSVANQASSGFKRVSAYVTGRVDAGAETCRRLSGNRYLIVRVGSRFFTVSQPRFTARRERPYYAYVKPLPRHRGTQTIDRGVGNKLVMPAESYVMFRLDGGRGKFKQIEVVSERARRGWATDMVRALLKAHPDAAWQNENLNKNSGPLFEQISARFPSQIARVTGQPDGTFTIAPPLYGFSPGTQGKSIEDLDQQLS